MSVAANTPVSDEIAKKFAMMFGDRLRSLRERRALSQKDLGELIGVHHATIASWEKGRNTPTLLAALNLVVALGVGSIEELFGPSRPTSELIAEAAQIPESHGTSAA